jgi:anti-sigma factor RsiW
MSAQHSQDFERLSAYVDNQLSTAEKAELEARLAREPELQANLNDLRRTVRALRALPDVKPPRSFTLTPQQAGVRVRRERGPLFATFRLAAALCTLLLVVAVARDFATSGALATSAGNTTVQGGATALSAPQAASLFSPTPETSDQAHSVAAAPATPSATAAPTSTLANGSDITPFARMSVVVPSATPTVSGPRPARTPKSTVESAAPGETPGGVAVANAAPSDTPADTAVSAGNLQPATSEAPAATSSAPAQAAPGLSGLRLAEIALAVLALALAAATWLTRRG